jgi:hypothetical protein
MMTTAGRIRRSPPGLAGTPAGDSFAGAPAVGMAA